MSSFVCFSICENYCTLSIRHTNILFYQFKECHENPSVSGHKKSGLPGLLGQAAVFMQFVMFPFLWLSAFPAGRTSPGRRVCKI